MRWNKAVELIDVAFSVNAEGATVESESIRKVFANPMRVGLDKWSAARSIGLHADASVEVRSAEYSGQERCRIDGVEYEVERAADRGEWTTLTLKRRLSNAG